MTTSNERPDLPPPDDAGAGWLPAPLRAAPSPSPLAPAVAPPPLSLEARAQAFGRETEAAAARLAAHPDLRAVGDIAGRVWGLVLLGVGLWFLARVTLHLPLPDIALETVWPAALILLGLLVIIRAARRS